MNDSEFGKKELESMEFEYFIDAYEKVVGKRLEVVGRTEKPDFICSKPNGSFIGVEVTKVMRDPKSAFFEKALYRREYMDSDEAYNKVWGQILRKNEKRKNFQGDGKLKFILVLQLMDCPIEELLYILEKCPKDEFAETGFSEIWLADYTGREAYGDIELFGLFPKKYWGHHQRPNPYRKPYG